MYFSFLGIFILKEGTWFNKILWLVFAFWGILLTLLRSPGRPSPPPAPPPAESMGRSTHLDINYLSLSSTNKQEMLTKGFQRFWLDETPGWTKSKLFHHLCCLLSHHSGKCEDFHLRLEHGCKNVQIKLDQIIWWCSGRDWTRCWKVGGYRQTSLSFWGGRGASEQ